MIKFKNKILNLNMDDDLIQMNFVFGTAFFSFDYYLMLMLLCFTLVEVPLAFKTTSYYIPS